MNKYKYKITMTVEVEAFDESDAWDMLQDVYAVGENCGTNVTDCEYKEIRGRSKRS